MGNPPFESMYLLLKMVVFQPAMLDYQRVDIVDIIVIWYDIQHNMIIG